MFILSVFEDLISPNTKWFKTSILLLCSYYTHLTHFIINCSLLINTPFQKKEILSENYSLDAAFFFRLMMLLNISQLTCYISSTCILGLQHLPKRVLIYRDYFEFWNYFEIRNYEERPTLSLHLYTSVYQKERRFGRAGSCERKPDTPTIAVRIHSIEIQTTTFSDVKCNWFFSECKQICKQNYVPFNVARIFMSTVLSLLWS